MISLFRPFNVRGDFTRDGSFGPLPRQPITAPMSRARPVAAYHAQVKRPEPEEEHPPAENVDSSRSISAERHSGHGKSRSASCMRRSISKALPQSRQRYSYTGKVDSRLRDAKSTGGVTTAPPQSMFNTGPAVSTVSLEAINLDLLCSLHRRMGNGRMPSRSMFSRRPKRINRKRNHGLIVFAAMAVRSPTPSISKVISAARSGGPLWLPKLLFRQESNVLLPKLRSVPQSRWSERERACSPNAGDV